MSALAVLFTLLFPYAHEFNVAVGEIIIWNVVDVVVL